VIVQANDTNLRFALKTTNNTVMFDDRYSGCSVGSDKFVSYVNTKYRRCYN